MNLTKIGTCLITILLLTGCTPAQESDKTEVTSTKNNLDVVVEWAPLYTDGKEIIDIHSTESQNILNETKILAIADQKNNSNVSLTSNGCLYNGDVGQDGTLFLITLLTNRTDNNIKNIHYDIKITLNSTGEVLGESAFDIPNNIYGDTVGTNIGYMAFLPFPDSPKKATGTVYLKDEITVQTNITYDNVEE